MTLLLTLVVMLACLATYALLAVMVSGRLGDLLLALSGTPRRSAYAARRASLA